MKEYQEYIQILEGSGKSANTIRAYKKDIVKFIEHFKIVNLNEIDDISNSDYRSFILGMNLSPSSQNGIIRNLSAFIHWLANDNYIVSDKLASVKFGKSKFVKEKIKEDKYLSKEEIEKLLEACENMDEYLMIRVLEYSALRRGSLVSIKVTDIDFEKNEIFIGVTKNNKPIKVYLSKKLAEEIRDYIEKRNSETKFLFVGKGTHDGITGDAVYIRIKTIARRAKISEERISEIHPHMFRHTWASNALSNGANIQVVAAALGHKSDAQVTRRYAHVLDSAVRNLQIGSES